MAFRYQVPELENPEPAPAEGPWPSEFLLFTQIPHADARRFQDEAFEQITLGTAPGHQVLMTEHPPTYLIGEQAEPWMLKLDDAACATHGFDRSDSLAADTVDYTGPGALSIHVAFALEHWKRDPDAFVTALEEVLLRALADFGIEADRREDGRAIMVGGKAIASIRTRVRRWVALASVSLHHNTVLEAFGAIRDADDEVPAMTTMAEQGMAIERQDEVRERIIHHWEAVFASKPHIPQKQGMKTAKPPWLRARVPFARGTEKVHDIIGRQKLHTVCESAHCPNMGECWAHGTATFMINGEVCTRSCSFCAIYTGRPTPLDPDEPRRVAEAAAEMGLRYVVVTAVNRDERKDGGAGQFADTIRALRAVIDGVHIEVLIPDFKGDAEALATVFEARPDVLNHNIETVPRLYKRVRPQARYQRSLDVIKSAKQAGLVTKSGVMLGLGETAEEIEQLLRDWRAHDCDIVTIGQYLRPSEKHHPVVRYVTPAEFAHWREFGEKLGFTRVESGPLVRSSYHAHESYRSYADGNS